MGRGRAGRFHMRLISAALAVGAFGLFASIHSANAEVTYPWCAQYGDPDGTRNCGFSSLDQCRAAVSGITPEKLVWLFGKDHAPAMSEKPTLGGFPCE